MVEKWSGEFKRGRTSTNDAERSGRPKYVTTPEIIDKKRQRVRDLKICLNLFNRNPRDFLRRLVTIDKTWIHHYTAESKQQTNQCVGLGETAPKRVKT